jgi:nucleoside-diphosphate-sugar epimerase
MGALHDGGAHVMVTGGAGYIGSRLTGELLARGCWVTVVDTLNFGGEPLWAYWWQPRFTFLRGDVCQEGVLLRAARAAAQVGAPPPAALIHLAAVVGFPACGQVPQEQVWRLNVEAVGQVFEQAEELGVERFIFASTYSNYGVGGRDALLTEESPLRPQSLYARSKIAAEQKLLDRKAASCAPLIFRFATLYGPSPRMRFDLIVNQFVLEAYTKGELILFQGDYGRSFVHIGDAIDGILLGLEAPIAKIRGQIYNLGSEEGNYTKEAIVSLICQQLPRTKVRYQDISFGGDMRDMRLSFAKVRRELGFRAQRTVQQGIAEILEGLRSGLLAEPFAPRYRNAPMMVQ